MISRSELLRLGALGVALLGLALLALPALGAFAMPAVTVTVTQPSGLTNLGESLDYMTHVWHDAWDMNEESDLFFFLSPTCPPQQSAMYANSTFAGGIWSGAYNGTTNDPAFWLINPGYRNSLHVGKDGNVHPIDATQYTQLTFRMYVGGLSNPAATSGAKLVWTNTDTTGLSNPNEYGMSKFFRLYPGWNIYIIDLTQIGRQQGNLNWGGSITGLELFTGLNAGGSGAITDVKIDWVRLTPKPTGNTVAWSGSWDGPTATAYIFVAPTSDGTYDLVRIYSSASQEPAPNIRAPEVIAAGADGISGSYANFPAAFPPGPMYVKVGVSDTSAAISSAAGPWQFNLRPDLTFVAPSYTSGEDYAASRVGNPWDMNDAADISPWANLQSAPSFAGGLATATSVTATPNCGLPWGDPQLSLNTQGIPVDTNYFRYLSVRVKINAPFDFGNGWVSRLLWVNDPTYSVFGVTNDLPLYTGWNTFHVDLWGNVLDDQIGGQTGWTTAVPTILRFDPHEIPPATQFEVDYVKVTANDTANRNSVFRVRYLPADPGATFTFYYDADTNPNNGRTPAAEFTPPPFTPGPHVVYLPVGLKNYPTEDSDPPGTQIYIWDLTGVAAGTYYLSADVDDGVNTTTWYSETPVIVKP